MTHVSDEIMKKVEAKEDADWRMSRCLAVKICPECGGGLARESLSDGGRAYNCGVCDFRCYRE